MGKEKKDTPAFLSCTHSHTAKLAVIPLMTSVITQSIKSLGLINPINFFIVFLQAFRVIQVSRANVVIQEYQVSQAPMDSGVGARYGVNGSVNFCVGKQ